MGRSRQMRKLAILGLAAGCFASMGASNALGSGFGIFTQGAKGLGQANAVVAHSAGPSTLFFNPALATGLTGTQLEVGTTVVLPSRTFESSATGLETDTKDGAYFPSSVYLTHAINKDLTAGMAIYNPFGLGNDWGQDWEGRYLTTTGTITTFNFNPSLAYRVAPGLSVAGGVDLVYLDASLERKLPVAPGLSDINQEFTGDGTGLGYNLGVAWDVTNQISLGAAYRSEVEIDVDGQAKFAVPADVSSFVPGIETLFPATGGKTELTLPRQLVLGVAYRPTSKAVVEIGTRYEDWRSFKETRVALAQPIGPFGQTEDVAPRDWHATWAFMLGGEYQVSPAVGLSAGYLYGPAAVPASTFEPGIPDSDSHLFTLGTNVDMAPFTLSLSYGYQYLENRDKETNQYGPLANGEYVSRIHLAGFSLGYKF